MSSALKPSPLIKPPEEFNPVQKAPPGRSWQCQEPGCGKITIKPYRWVVGAKTTLLMLENVLQKMALLEKHIMALHQRMDDQCGKP